VSGRRSLVITLAVLVVGLAATGCGDDSSGETTPSLSIPAVTSPTSSAPSVSGTSPATTQKSKTAPTGTYNPNAPDSPTNDVPPPPGSPQEQFEQQCRQNPEACG
jgi:hypothetical protein